MAELVSSLALPAAANLTGASVGAVILAAVGVDPTTIGWALAGGFLGAAYGPKVGPVKTVLNYLASSLISALGATALMHWWIVAAEAPRYITAAMLAFFFYPIKDAAIARIGVMFDRALEKVFGPRPDAGRDGQ